jgi:hypothetical protein
MNLNANLHMLPPVAAGGAGVANPVAPPLPPDLPMPPLPFASGPGSISHELMSLCASQTQVQLVAEVNRMLSVYNGNQPNMSLFADAITNSDKLMCFLTISRNGLVSVAHTLGKYSAGLDMSSAAQNRVFALLGEKIGGQLPPGVMVPTAGLVPMLTLKPYGVPPKEDLVAELEAADPSVALATTTAGQVAGQGEWVELSQLVYIPQKWAPYLMKEMTAWQALKVLEQLTASLPVGLQTGVSYLLKWARVACTKESAASPFSALHVKWQSSPPGDRDVIEWQQRRYTMLCRTVVGPPAPAALNPQAGFDAALQTMLALKPQTESTNKSYTTLEMKKLRASMSLLPAEMDTDMPIMHAQLLQEGRSKKGTAAVLHQFMITQADCDFPSLTWLSPDLIRDIQECNYGDFDISGDKCDRGISPFAVPAMSLKHQQEHQ